MLKILNWIPQNSRHSIDSKVKCYQLRRWCLRPVSARLTWDCSISALFSLTPRISAASLWKQRCTYGGERRRQISPRPNLRTHHFSQTQKRSKPVGSPSLPSLLIRTDWWGRSPGRAAGVCQLSLSSCAPGRLQTKHSVAREVREAGVEYERQMDWFIAMVVRCSCRVSCYLDINRKENCLHSC